MAKKKPYPFVDIVIDVFFSIVLYNALIAFPGVGLNMFLMILSIFIMVNYWWASRSNLRLVKHYLMDYYFVVIIMFFFMQWTNYYASILEFIYILVLFYACDSMFNLIGIYAHKERRDEASLQINFITEMVLAIYYIGCTFFVRTVTPYTLLLLFAPVIILFIVNVKTGHFKTRFEFEGEAPLY